MLRVFRLFWLTMVIVGGAALVLFALATDDPGGAAVLAGIALLLGLASFLLPGGDTPDRRKPRGFEPHRRR